MDNYKLVTILIFALLKGDRNVIFFKKKNIHEKPLGFGCMHENNTFSFYFILF